MIQLQFLRFLPSEELSVEYDIRKHIDQRMLFQRFQQLTGIRFTSESVQKLNAFPLRDGGSPNNNNNNSSSNDNTNNEEGNDYYMVEYDIKKVGAKVSRLNIVNFAGIQSTINLSIPFTLE